MCVLRAYRAGLLRNAILSKADGDRSYPCLVARPGRTGASAPALRTSDKPERKPRHIGRMALPLGPYQTSPQSL